jgi:hypothetical protein
MKHTQAIGITILAAAVTLTGCGGSKRAKVSGATGSVSAVASGLRPSASAATTVRGTVRAGGYCSVTNAAGRTAEGTEVRCVTRPGETRKRWVVVTGSTTGAKAGRFCTPEGATAKAADGTMLTCAKKSGQRQARWVKK